MFVLQPSTVQPSIWPILPSGSSPADVFSIGAVVNLPLSVNAHIIDNSPPHALMVNASTVFFISPPGTSCIALTAPAGAAKAASAQTDATAIAATSGRRNMLPLQSAPANRRGGRGRTRHPD